MVCGFVSCACCFGVGCHRRDSFITHRAFCDALAEESARTNPLLSLQPTATPTVPHLTLQSHLHSHALQPFPPKSEPDQQQCFSQMRQDFPPWLPNPPVVEPASAPPSAQLSSQLFYSRLDHQPYPHKENVPIPNPRPSPTPNPMPFPSLPHFQSIVSPHMSATSLLQKAAQMGVTVSKTCPPEAMLRSNQAQAHHINVAATTPAGFSCTSLATSIAGSGLGLSSCEDLTSGFVHGLASFGSKAAVTSPSMLHDMMSSLSSTSGFEGPSFDEEAISGILDAKIQTNLQATLTKPATETHLRRGNEGGGGGNDGLTRDFLGLRPFSHGGFPNMVGLDRINFSSSYDQHNHNQTSWQG